MRYYVDIEGRTYEVGIGPDGVTLDGRPVEADLQAGHGSRLWHLILDGRSYTLVVRPGDRKGAWEIESGGRRHRVVALDERRRAIRQVAGGVGAAAGAVEVRAPMPGLVLAVEVAEGEHVEPGQGLVVIEAMKMENELRAETEGAVSEVRVAPGQAVDRGELLLVIDAGEG